MRTFFGIAIKNELLQSANLLVDEAKSTPDMQKIRWTPSSNWHLTLRFMGNTRDEQLDQLVELVTPIAQDIASFDIESNGVIFLPDKHPRIFGLSVRLNESLAQIVQGLNQAAQHCGFTADKRLFLPHVTLGRWKPGAAHAPHIQLKHFGEQTVKAFHLYKSENSEQGSVYTPIKTFCLPSCRDDNEST